EFGDLRLESITGNWYFSENEPDPIGVCWSKNSKATPEGWQFVIEDELGLFEPGTRKTTEKMTLSIGAFQQWEDFKSFAVSSSTVEMSEVCEENIFESENIIVNADSELSLLLKSFRNSYMDGQLRIAMDDKEIYQTVITPEEEKTSSELRIKSSEFDAISVLKGEFRTNSMLTQIEELVLCPSNTEVTSQSLSVDTFSVYVVNNGCITLKAAPDFYPGLFSINVNGVEWLDTSFPNVTAKSWWNPWAGGMKTSPSGLTTYSLMKEQNSASPTEIRDSKGNMWSGLAVSTEMIEHPEWKGVHFVQYYLMLPGVPVIATYLEVKESAGKNLKHETWNTDLFIGNEVLTKIKMNVSGNTNQYTAGVQELPMHFEMGDYFTSSSKGDKFYLVPSLYNEHAEAYTNKHAFPVLLSQSAIPSENEMKTAPVFMVFDERILTKNLLKKLRRIEF
ncbi:MAG TPA: hypothetical protein VK190_10110, partial [Pseudoneobacillus sp.]|nr:hypothetical protein [Pseudoneobacillus sp.]